MHYCLQGLNVVRGIGQTVAGETPWAGDYFSGKRKAPGDQAGALAYGYCDAVWESKLILRGIRLTLSPIE